MKKPTDDHFNEQDGTDLPSRDQNRSQANRLIDYALESGAESFNDQHGSPHGVVDGETVPLNTRACKWLRILFWNKENTASGDDTLKTMIGVDPPSLQMFMEARTGNASER